MPVPDTVTNIRTHIVGALKLALVELDLAVTVLGLDDDYGSRADKTKYPLAKVWAGKSRPSTPVLGPLSNRSDEMFVAIAPWCTGADFEAACDALVATNLAGLTDAVRAQMDAAYAPYLGKIELTQAETLDTGLQNPRGVVQWTLGVTYRLT